MDNFCKLCNFLQFVEESTPNICLGVTGAFAHLGL